MGLFAFLKRIVGGSESGETTGSGSAPNRVDPVFGELVGGGGEWIASMPLNSDGAAVEVCILIDDVSDEHLDRAFELAGEQFKAMLASTASLKKEVIDWIQRYFAETGDPLDIDITRLALPGLDNPLPPDSVRITRDPIELDSIVVGIDDMEPSLTLSYTGIIYNHWCHFQLQDGRLVHAEVDG